MKFYRMCHERYHHIWDTIEDAQEWTIQSYNVDQWLLNNYGLKAVIGVFNIPGHYLFEVLDEQKLILFELKWS